MSQATNAQWQPDISFGGGIYMVVWHDNREGDPHHRVYGARITAAGTVLDTNGILIGTADSCYQTCPSIVFNGATHFVIWYSVSPNRILGRFIDGTGFMSDTFNICNCGYTSRTRLAFSSTNYLVVWIESQILYGQVVSLSGAPVGTPFFIDSPVHSWTLSLHYDGTQYCVTYSLSEGGVYKTWGKKYDLYGSPVGNAFRVTTSPHNQLYSDFIPGGNNRYLNVWAESDSEYNIYGNIDISINGIYEQEQRIYQRRAWTSIVAGPLMLPAGKNISIYDLTGAQIKNAELSPGIYFIKENGNITRKIIKIK